MKHILDTCALSELVARRPNQKVLSYIGSLSEEDVIVCSVVLGELRKGIDRLDSGNRRHELLQWLEHDLIPRFSGRILSFDTPSAMRWGLLVAQCEKKGRVLPVLDSLLAAVCLEHGARLVTRNVADFDGTGVDIVNPWD